MSRSLTALAVVTLLACGCAHNLREKPRAADLEAKALEVTQEYKIGPRDRLRITVWREPELSVDNIEVRPDGKISVPLLDDVQAEGLTALELKAVIAERLEDYVTTPNVTVSVIAVQSNLVFVLGEVQREGAVPIQARMRAVDAIASVGGFSTFADKSEVKILRQRDGEPSQEFVFDYEDFVDGKDIEQNILLLPGDRIIVPEQKPFWQ